MMAAISDYTLGHLIEFVHSSMMLAGMWHGSDLHLFLVNLDTSHVLSWEGDLRGWQKVGIMERELILNAVAVGERQALRYRIHNSQYCA